MVKFEWWDDRVSKMKFACAAPALVHPKGKRVSDSSSRTCTQKPGLRPKDSWKETREQDRVTVSSPESLSPSLPRGAAVGHSWWGGQYSEGAFINMAFDTFTPAAWACIIFTQPHAHPNTFSYTICPSRGHDSILNPRPRCCSVPAAQLWAMQPIRVSDTRGRSSAVHRPHSRKTNELQLHWQMS